MHDLISMRDLTLEDVERHLASASRMEAKLFESQSLHAGQIAATLFFEPSTRTALSFQTAAQRLGMTVIPYDHERSSSKKGESLTDTLHMVDGYADILVMRHAHEGAARLGAQVCEHPLVNAGDGGNQHPSQALIDLYTIQKAKGRIQGLEVALVGDLKHARAMRSLLYGLGMFKAQVRLIAPPGLEMDPAIVEETERRFGLSIESTDRLDLSSADVVYVCRIQKERFADPFEAQKLQATYRITPELLKGAKDDMILMHPLPRLDELPAEIDALPQAHYFKQARNGVPVRMAILHDCLSR